MDLITKDYSVTGISSGGGITYTYILRVTENSVDPEKNTSDVTVQAILKQNYSGTAFAYWGTGVSCTINGEEIFSDYKQRRLSGTFETVYYTWNGVVEHNNDGSKSLTVGGKIWQSEYANFSPPPMTIEESEEDALELTTIPRSSLISAGDADIGSMSTVIISRSVPEFTHSIAYEFGDLSGYIGADGNPTDSAARLTETTLAFNLPMSFYEQIPNDKYGVCTLTCRTFLEDTVIGEGKSCSFKVRAVQEECAPVVTGTVVDVNQTTKELTGEGEPTIVRYMSELLCTIDVTTRNSAGGIVSKKINGVEIEGNTYIIENPQIGQVLFEATDSRGYPGSCSLMLPVVPYICLTCNASVKRTDPTSGNAVITIEQSEFFKGSFGAADNALKIWYQIGDGEPVEILPEIGEDGGYTARAEVEGLDYRKAHTINLWAEDALMRVPKTLPVRKGIPVFDWGEADFAFNVPVKLKEGISGSKPAGLVAYPVGAIYMSIYDTSPDGIFGGAWEPCDVIDNQSVYMWRRTE